MTTGVVKLRSIMLSLVIGNMRRIRDGHGLPLMLWHCSDRQSGSVESFDTANMLTRPRYPEGPKGVNNDLPIP